MTIKIIDHRKIEVKNIRVPCKCGCGQLIWKFDKKQRERFYARSHSTKNRGYLINSWNKGRKGVFSEETLKKMSIAKLGKPSLKKGIKMSEEQKKKMSIVKLNEWKDKKQSEASRKFKLRAKNMARKIPLKPYCEICGTSENRGRHHWNYNKPLMVNTLCKTCHDIQHIKHFERSKYGQSEVLA